jgi:predicted RNase H-like nuclease
LRPKLLEVDQWVRRASPPVVEIHPEVSFAELAGTPLTASKKAWVGMVRRLELLAAAGIVIPDDLGAAGVAGVDDVIDAAAAGWTARRIALGEAQSLPDPPEVFSDGISAAIWC